MDPYAFLLIISNQNCCKQNSKINYDYFYLQPLIELVVKYCYDRHTYILHWKVCVLMKKIFLISISLVITIILLNGCKKNEVPTTKSKNEINNTSITEFEKMINSIQKEMPDLVKKRYDGVYSDITVTGNNDNTITYTYKYSSEVDIDFQKEIDSIKQQLNDMEMSWKKSMRSEFDRMKVLLPELDIYVLKISAVFLDPHGNKLGSFSVTQKQLDEIQKEEENNTFYNTVQDARKYLSHSKELISEVYSDVTIHQGEDTTLIYEYTFQEHQDEFLPEFELKTAIYLYPFFKFYQTTISNLKVKSIYFNPDHSEIYQFTLTQEEVEAIDNMSNESY